jgi:hypothetical protein
MIIWGSCSRQLVTGEGHFQCPHCRRQTQCKLIRLARYFTLYFIPLFETANLGEFIVCQVCQSAFDPLALGYDPNAPEGQEMASPQAAATRPGGKRKKGGRPVR